MFWHPSVDSAMAGDSVLITEHGCEVLTRSGSWPELNVQVKGHELPCPGILRIPGGSAADMETEQQSAGASPFAGLSFEEDEGTQSRMDSIWEMELCSDQSVYDEDDAPYSEESVLE